MVCPILKFDRQLCLAQCSRALRLPPRNAHEVGCIHYLGVHCNMQIWITRFFSVGAALAGTNRRSHIDDDTVQWIGSQVRIGFQINHGSEVHPIRQDWSAQKFPEIAECPRSRFSEVIWLTFSNFGSANARLAIDRNRSDFSKIPPQIFFHTLLQGPTVPLPALLLGRPVEATVGFRIPSPLEP